MSGSTSTSNAGATPPPAPKQNSGGQAQQQRRDSSSGGGGDFSIPLYSFTPAMFVEAEEDFTQPPPPLAPSSSSLHGTSGSRLPQTIANIDRHARAVQDNMWRMVLREKARLDQDLKQKILLAQQAQQVQKTTTGTTTPASPQPQHQRSISTPFATERLSTVSAQAMEALLDNVQAPETLFYDVRTPSASASAASTPGDSRLSAEERSFRAQLAQQQQAENERLRLLRGGDAAPIPPPPPPPPSSNNTSSIDGGGDSSGFEVGPNITRSFLAMQFPETDRMPPREYIRARTLDVVTNALQNIEGYGDRVPDMHETARREVAMEAALEVARSLEAMAPPKSTSASTPAPTPASAPMPTTAAMEVNKDIAPVGDSDPMDIDSN